MRIYEVHLGSWARVPEDGNRPLTYREIAPRLAEHVKQLGFTHVELMPVMEHPFYGSWGYQVTGYYAPTSRYGTPDDFRFLVDTLHQHGIGVILDWVPAHFPKDDFALRRFDGTALYEHEDPRLGEHPDWGTLIFNYGRNEVRNFLIANALYWLDEFHVDGLRVDAVASMLYLDYSRKAGEWIPNQLRRAREPRGDRVSAGVQRGRACLGARVASRSPRSPPRGPASRSRFDEGGLGFTFKWNMGWMHDTLAYFSLDPIHRRFHHDQLTFAMLYEYSERFIMPLSHDEVVHLKGSLLAQDAGRRMAEVRQSAPAARVHVHAPGQEAALHGHRARASGRSGITTRASTGICSIEPHRAAFLRSCRASRRCTTRCRRSGGTIRAGKASTGSTSPTARTR